GVIVLYRPQSNEVKPIRELNEAVTYGNGLLYIGEHPDSDPNLSEAEGVTSAGGNLSAITSVQLTGTLGAQSVAASGSAANLGLVAATLAGQVLVNGNLKPVAATNHLGLGRSALLAWDPERVPSAPLADLYLQPVAFVAPAAHELVP